MLEEACKKFGLTNEDLNRLHSEGIIELIKCNKKQLNTWSISGCMKKNIEEEIKYLEVLLKYALKEGK